MLRDRALGAYLDSLASDAPAPGGGAAAALTLAQSAALLSMVCALTLGKERFADRETAIRACHEDATAVQNAALRLADADQRAYEGYRTAAALPKGTPQEAEIRSQAVQGALKSAAAVPLAVLKLSWHLLAPGGAVERLAEIGNPSVLSDVHVARYLAVAAYHASAANVRVNLEMIKDGALKAEFEAALNLDEKARIWLRGLQEPNPTKSGVSVAPDQSFVLSVLQALPEGVL